MAENPPLVSPCVGVCEMDDARLYCKGCLRTIPEIKQWGCASEPEKWEILSRLKERRRQLGWVSQASEKPRRRDSQKIGHGNGQKRYW